jgi:hypothetical protein
LTIGLILYKGIVRVGIRKSDLLVDRKIFFLDTRKSYKTYLFLGEGLLGGRHIILIFIN